MNPLPDFLGIKVSSGVAIASAGLLSVASAIPDLPPSWSSAPIHLILGLVCLGSLYMTYHLSVTLTREHHASITALTAAITASTKAQAESTEAIHAIVAELKAKPCLLQRIDPRFASDLDRAREHHRP